MRSTIVATAVAAAALTQAEPTRSTKQEPKRTDSLPQVTVSGNAFYAGSDRFYMRGIDYQPGGSSANEDPIADTKVCERDIPLFKDLGVNTVRIYSVDNSKDHTECMKQLSDAGIYLVLDVNNPQYSINRDDPSPSYNADYLQSVFATIDEFAQYDNTLAFFSGNEVINDQPKSTGSAPYVKATTRDMRAYIQARGYRSIPVGYSAADVSQTRVQTAQYFNCGADSERSDFFAFNDYSWCPGSSFQESGWNQKVETFSGYGLPIFLSEWGCNKAERNFDELSALMSDQMDSVYSGGLMFEYSQEGDHYGIVTLNGNSDPVKNQEYSNFKSALAKYPAPTGSGGASPTQTSQACPTLDGTWEMGEWGQSNLPAMPSGALSYFDKGAGTGPGLNGPGSQNSGSETHPTGSTSVPTGSNPTQTGGSDDDTGAGARPVPPMDFSIFAITGVVSVFTVVGTLLL